MHDRRSRIAVAFGISVITLGLGLAPVLATTTLDQAQAQMPTGWERYNPHGYWPDESFAGVGLAQSFVPSKASTMVAVDLFIIAAEDWAEPLTVQLRRSGPNGTVAATSTIPLTDIPTHNQPEWVRATLDQPLDVFPGTELTVVLPPLAATARGDAAQQPTLFWARRTGDAYPKAAAFMGSRSGQTAGDEAAWASVPSDFSFRTQVLAAPEAVSPNTATEPLIDAIAKVPSSPIPLFFGGLLAMVGVVWAWRWQTDRVRRAAQLATANAAAEEAEMAAVRAAADIEPPPSTLTTSDFVTRTGGTNLSKGYVSVRRDNVVRVRHIEGADDPDA
jgi:hypothetical protein